MSIDEELNAQQFVVKESELLQRFAAKTYRDMQRVGHATYTHAEWFDAYLEWRKLL